jgi:tetratricopeptide (TPR) repeat protein
MSTRFIICLAILAQAGWLSAATPTEEIAFDAAVRAFEDQFYDRAEEQFSNFTRLYPDSDLFQNAKGFTLRARAHNLAEKKEHAGAAKTFRQLRLDFPNSPNHLEYVVGEAWNEYFQGKLETVTTLLGDPLGPFRQAATIRPNDPIALPLLVSGQLLLAQAYVDQGEFTKAEEVLNSVTDWDLRTEFSWRRRMIITQLQLAKGELEMALQNADALMDLANSTEDRIWIAESAAIFGELLIANNQPEAAIVKYQKNLVPGTPPLRHREAWFKIIELNLEQRDAQSVIELLNQFIAQAENDESLDVALLTLGELNLQRYYEEDIKPEQIEGEGKASAIDYLNESRVQLERLIKEFPSSPLLPKAQYHLGWCYWENSESQESVDAFRQAAEQLPKGDFAAKARFKLADGYYVLGQYQEALDNYKLLIESYENVTKIKETFLDQVLYQIVRASVEADDVDSAQIAINKLIAYYPDTLLANTSSLLLGQHLIHIDNVSRAREVLFEMIEHFTGFPLKAEVYYAIAYSYELEGDWPRATGNYRTWIEDYPEHGKQPNASYALAWCTSQQGKNPEALELFRDFIKKNGAHELAHLARLWLGNFHFNLQNFEAAERQYTVIMRSTPPNPPYLRHPAALMAGRASFRLNQFKKAVKHLSDLSEEIKDEESVSPSFKAKVALNLGDALFEQGKVEVAAQVETIKEARLSFSKVSALHLDSRLAAIAWGRYGDASYFLKEYPDAIDAYEEVIGLPEADITIRSQAEVALGMVLERQAEAPSKETGASDVNSLIESALQHYLNVVYLKNLRANELPDPFWLEEAGIKAGNLVEAKQDIETGIKLYQRLAELLPSLREDWDRLRLALESKKNNK